MKDLLNQLYQGAKIIINGKEYIVKTKTWYSTEQDTSVSYVKCELSNEKILVISPEDNFISLGEIIDNMNYKRVSKEEIIYEDVTFKKTGEGNQFITKIEFGDKKHIEGKCIFEDYESENNVISLGILPDKENKKADVYAEIIKIEDIEFK